MDGVGIYRGREIRDANLEDFEGLRISFTKLS